MVSLRWLSGVAVAVVLSGCASFRSDLRAARERGIPPSGVEGHWVGRWYDLKNPKHGGRLECVLTRTGDQVYRMSSRSQWWKIFTSAYDANVVITPTAEGRAVVLGGQELWVFGGHSLTGRIDGTRFEATYTVGSHSGRLELQRP
ncbi:MAG: hypothetical protein JNK85_07190 [Verrucomicrobiales bacterium]|nr:hypothetical protein [Verrucomicrobiales bacterium]